MLKSSQAREMMPEKLSVNEIVQKIVTFTENEIKKRAERGFSYLEISTYVVIRVIFENEENLKGFVDVLTEAGYNFRVISHAKFKRNKLVFISWVDEYDIDSQVKSALERIDYLQ